MAVWQNKLFSFSAILPKIQLQCFFLLIIEPVTELFKPGTTDYRYIFQDTGQPGTGQGPGDRNDLYPCDPPALFLFSGRSGIFSHRRCAHDEDCGREGGRPGTIGGG